VIGDRDTGDGIVDDFDIVDNDSVDHVVYVARGGQIIHRRVRRPARRAVSIASDHQVGVRVRPLGIAAQHAELVAFRIGHRHPTAAVRVAMIGDLAGTQLEQPLDLLVAGTVGRRQVEMNPVLDHLAIRYLLEPRSR